MRVLAIDDNADNLVALTALLRSYLPGCLTASARSGREGLGLARDFHPDVILLDIQMPGMDGFEVCRALKADPETAHVPVIFLTALSATPASRIKALECGGDAFLAKPVEPGELMAQVRAMVRLKAAEDALRGENRSLERAVGERTAALTESRRLLAAIVNGTTDRIWVKDRAGRFLVANAAALRALGRPAGEVLGRTEAELSGDGSGEALEAADRRVLETGETFSQDERAVVGGRSRTFTSLRGPVRDAEGHVTGLFAVIRDISDRARARLVLQKETERVQALLALYRDPGRTESDVLRAAVEGLARLTGSELGLIGLPDGAGGALRGQGWSAGGADWVGPPGRALQHLLRPGLPWADALRSGQPAVENEAGRHQGALPEGHLLVRRLLTVPVVREGRVVLVGGVANRDEAYGELDVAQAGLYLEGVWEALQRVAAEQQRAALEDQLRQAAKMEAVGRLAGGVAHDFNNLLSVILSYSSFALETLEEASPLRADLEEIRRAGERAASLTRQLLAHSRKQVLQVTVLDLAQVVEGIEPMLRRLLGEDLALELQLAPGLWPVEGDRGQLEQVIVNLAVNARDALPQGGQVIVRARNHAPAPAPAAGPWDAEGVLLEVSDDGVGMDEATRSRVFEPFFTTKGPGRGTGLGLATVYGIVKQSGGDVQVESAPGRGTTFRILLPRAAGLRACGGIPGPSGAVEAQAAQGAPTEHVPLTCEGGATPRCAADRPHPRREGISSQALGAAAPTPTPPAGRARGGAGGPETILVVEDEEAVRALAARILSGAGYRVVAAADGGEALEQFARHRDEVRLLLTDVIMPHMSGHELAERLRALEPGLRVLFMSGYPDEALGRHGVLSAKTRFIGKPFEAAGLTHLVREVLDEEAGGRSVRA